MSQIVDPLLPSLVSVFAFLAVIALHRYVAVSQRKRQRRRAAGLTLLWLAIAGASLLWWVLDIVLPVPRAASPAFLLKTGGLSLYFIGVIVYLEARSLLSRGYSLRILVDLAERRGATTLRDAKSGYGQGLGVDGLLVKRINTLCDLGLVQFDGATVGPSTRLGIVSAVLGSGIRRILRVDNVG